MLVLFTDRWHLKLGAIYWNICYPWHSSTTISKIVAECVTCWTTVLLKNLGSVSLIHSRTTKGNPEDIVHWHSPTHIFLFLFSFFSREKKKHYSRVGCSGRQALLPSNRERQCQHNAEHRKWDDDHGPWRSGLKFSTIQFIHISSAKLCSTNPNSKIFAYIASPGGFCLRTGGPLVTLHRPSCLRPRSLSPNIPRLTWKYTIRT